VRRARSRTGHGRAAPPRRQAGLSLIELMISITLGLLLLSGVAYVFVNTSSARNEVERTSRQIENGRYAVEVIADDLRLAGFYGELNVGSVAAPGALPADQCTLAAADWNTYIPLHVQGFDNGAGFSQATCTLTNYKANTDILLVRRARACVAGATDCDAVTAGRPYIQVSLCASEVTTHLIGLEGSTTFNLKNKGTQATPCNAAAGKRQYLVHIYYISTDNGSGVNVPTLKRLELTGAGWATTPLVEGIEEFNAVYGIDTDGDGAPDSYSAAPATITDWLNVVTVQFYILARNLETSPDYVDTKTYTLGIDADGDPVTVNPGLGYRRHVYSSLVRLTNPAGRRDVP
jgi:type IV pilus assembly protein PilW